MPTKYTDARARLAEIDRSLLSNSPWAVRNRAMFRATLAAFPLFLNAVYDGPDVRWERDRFDREYRLLLREGATALQRTSRFVRVTSLVTFLLTMVIVVGCSTTAVIIYGHQIPKTGFALWVVLGGDVFALVASIAGAMGAASAVTRRAMRKYARSLAFYATASAFTVMVRRPDRGRRYPSTSTLMAISRYLRLMDRDRRLPTRDLQAVFADRERYLAA
ncbi:hypothetical protein ACFQ1S_33300, partial [Kibdelosporangium lantanae]